MRSQSILSQVDEPGEKKLEEMEESWKQLLSDWDGEKARSEGVEAGDCSLVAWAFKHHLIF